MSWYVARSLDQLLAEINASAPNRNKASDGSIGDANHSSRESDHNPCDCHRAVCARDFTHDPGGGFDAHAFANWLAERTKNVEARVKYIISNGRIASGQGQSNPAGVWRPYTGSNPHTKHVHVSVRHGIDLFDDASGWGWSGSAGPTPPVPQIGKDQMFAIIRYPDGRCYRWNGQTRLPIPNPTLLGGDQIMLSALKMDATVWNVDPVWADSYPEVTDGPVYWNTVVTAQQVGVPEHKIA